MTVQTIEGAESGSYFGHSVGDAGDVNRDGFDDVIVSAMYAGRSEGGRVWVYLGSVTGVDTNRVWSMEGWLKQGEYGHQVTGGLDVNGDGFSDIVIGWPILQTNDFQGAVQAFYGSAQGLGAIPDWEAFGMAANESNIGFSVDSAGDVNGDGYDDLLVGAPYERMDTGDTKQVRRGCARLFLGGPGGLAKDPVWFAGHGQERMSFAWSVSGAGDLNGDGYHDVVIGDMSHSTTLQQVGRAQVFYGGASGLPSTPDWTITGTQAGQQIGVSVHGAGDLNGDGYADLVIAANHTSNGQDEEGMVLVFQGSSSGLASEPSWVFEPNQVGFILGHSVASAGDLNGDGFGDLVIGSFYGEQAQADEGVVLVFHGSRSGLGRIPDWSGRGGARHSGYGATVRRAGDVNGDGFGDLIIGQTHYSGMLTNEGRIHIHFGSSRGLSGSTHWRPPGEKLGFEFRSVVVPFPNLAWIGAGAIVSMGLMFWLGSRYDRYRERMAAAARAARENTLREERLRISQDLHDQLGAHLTCIALGSGNIRRAIATGEHRVLSQLETIETTAGQLVDNLSEIVWLTRPANDSLEQLVNYLIDYVGKVMEPAGIRCQIEAPSALPNQMMDYDLRHDLLLAVKEALHNVVKHSRARSIVLSFGLNPEDRIIIEIHDDGVGFPTGAASDLGNGIRNMRERMQRHGGSFEVVPSAAASGTLVRLSVPLRGRSIIA